MYDEQVPVLVVGSGPPAAVSGTPPATQWT